MTHDREVNISTAGKRSYKHWRQQKTTVSAFIDKLVEPARGRETLAEFLKLPKTRQDDLKDVGGYVFGELRDGRRGAVISRDAVTIDLDSIPAGGADEALAKVAALGYCYAAHSTRKHSPDHPRLRAIIFLDRSVTPDEYEAIARRLAEQIGIEWCDQGTYQPSRLMYWPSACADGEYLFSRADRPFANADAILATYDDWRDMKTRPHALREPEARQRHAERALDPTQKKGVVGAFCRAYSVHRAIEEFLPDVYERAAGTADRYTYTGGSTAGGAVIYQDGLFLYSHHATDPAGGRLCNAFDLVRLHLYGDMDSGADPDTPVNRLPSYTRMTAFAKQDEAVARLLAEEKGADIMAAFEPAVRDAAAAREELTMFLGALEKQTVTTQMVRNLLAVLGITVRYNVITNTALIGGRPITWSAMNAENNLPTHLLDFLRPAKVVGATRETVNNCLDLIADENRFNPVYDLVHDSVWDGADRVAELLDIWNVHDATERKLVYKWLHQCVALALNDEVNPVGADGVLTLLGEQGIGKTEACRALAPSTSLFGEGMKIDFRNPDTKRQALMHWITELGELERTTTNDHEALRAFITDTVNIDRTPYAVAAVRRPRRTSFCGTVNKPDFLIDDAGNRRFWVIRITYIDLKRMFALTDEWRAQLWTQVYQAYLADKHGFRLTAEDRAENAARNKEFLRALDYEIEVREMLDLSQPYSKWKDYKTSEIAAILPVRPPLNRLGRALNKIVRDDPRMSVKVLNGISHYKLPFVQPHARNAINARTGGFDDGGK